MAMPGLARQAAALGLAKLRLGNERKGIPTNMSIDKSGVWGDE
jgi:hypothetical protein